MAGIRIPHGAWVLVGDGEKALFLRNKGDAQYPHLVVERVLGQENPLTREQGTDEPGRRSDIISPQRSAMEETDWHRIGKERFARTLADLLYQAAHAGRFDKIVIAAPPTTLGDLRQHLHEEVKARMIGTVAKDLTHHQVDQIERILTTKE